MGMHSSRRFRLDLAARVAGLLALASTVYACGGNVVVDGPPGSDGDGGASGQGGDAQTTMCLDWLDDGPCPAKEEALPYLPPYDCNVSVVSVDAGPFYTSEEGCCYTVSEIPSTCSQSSGRPYLSGGAALTAPARTGAARGWRAERIVPSVEGLDGTTHRAGSSRST
jgi:hypothetical protein